MTKRARELGLAKVDLRQFERPARSAPAHDRARARQARAPHHPDLSGLLPLYGEREFTCNKIRQFNRNPLLAMNIGADGLKTGFTKEAGYGLVGSAVQNGLRLIVVVNGLKTEKERADEAKKLLEWGFHNFQSSVLFEDGQAISDAKVYGGEQGYVPLVAQRAVRLMVPRGVRERIIARVVYTGPVPAPVGRRARRSASSRSGAATTWCSKCRCRRPKASAGRQCPQRAPSMPRPSW